MQNRYKGIYRSKKYYISALCLYFFCLPLNTINIGIGSILKIIAIIPVGIALLSTNGRIIIYKVLEQQIAFTLFAILSILWSINRGMSIDRCITYFLLTMLLLSGSVFTYDSSDISKIRNAMLWSSRTTGLVMLLFSDFRYGRFMLSGLIVEDPNYLCGYLMVGILIVISKLFEGGSKKTLDIIELTLYIFLILGTGSRGGLISVSAAIILWLMTYKNSGFTNSKKYLFVFIIIVIVSLVMVFIPEELMSRFSIADVVTSKGTGRFDIWKEGIRVFKESDIFHQLFGIGTGTITEVLVVMQYNRYHHFVMHNIFLETLVELGIIGLVIYMLNIARFLYFAKKLEDNLSLCVIVGMIILSMSTSLHTFKPYFNIMLFIIISSKEVNQYRELGE